VYSYLTNTVNYATTNTVHFITAYAKANGSALDAGQTNLIHEKYMVIDPWSEQPTVILGSPNWSKAALVDTNQNDENIVFMRHKDIARMYYAQFKRMTGVWQAREDFWCDVSNAPPGCAFGLWMTDSNSFRVEQAAVPAGPWTTNLTSISGFVGHFTRPVTRTCHSKSSVRRAISAPTSGFLTHRAASCDYSTTFDDRAGPLKRREETWGRSFFIARIACQTGRRTRRSGRGV